MVKFYSFLTTVVAGIATTVVSAQIPTDSLALWLRSDTGVVTSGANVLSWTDFSGNGRNATAQLGTYPQLVPNQFCNKPVINFASSSGMSIPPFQSWSNKRGTMIVVARAFGGTGGGGYGTITSTYLSSGIQWQFGASSTTYSYYDGVGGAGTPVTISPPTQFGIITVKRMMDDTMDFYKSGVLISRLWINNNQPDVNPFFIGYNGNFSFIGGEALNGDIAEIIFYNKSLTPAEQYQVDAYLANKYCLNSNVPVPTVIGDQRCGNGVVTLSASGAIHYRWYDSPSSSVILDTNSTFVTPVLSSTDTFWVANYNDTLESVRVPVVAVVNPNPAVTLTLNPDTLCVANAAVLLSGGNPAAGVYSGNGVSAGYFDPAVAGVGVTTIIYTVTDSNMCTGSDSALVLVDLCMGLTPVSSNVVEIFPNPGSGSFVVSGIYDAADIRIYNLVGETVYHERSLQYGDKMLDLDFLPVGIYTAEISNDVQVCNVKIIIQR